MGKASDRETVRSQCNTRQKEDADLRETNEGTLPVIQGIAHGSQGTSY